MMEQRDLTAPEELSLWRQIVDFPLVAMIIAIGIFALLMIAAMAVEYVVPGSSRADRAPLLALIIIPFWLLVYKRTIALLGERPRDELRISGLPKYLGLGFAGGFLLSGAVVGLAALADVYSIVRFAGFNNHPLGFLAIALITAFREELLFRGILFRWIEEFSGSWAALLVTSALFGLAHIFNPGATWFSSFAIATEAGLLLGGAYMLTRNLWLPIGVHLAWNFTQGTIFGVPVSGGRAQGIVEARLSGPELLSGAAFGLEASVISLVVCTAAGVSFVWLAVRRGELVQPSWVRRRISA